jgi:hypothetical protein
MHTLMHVAGASFRHRAASFDLHRGRLPQCNIMTALEGRAEAV